MLTRQGSVIDGETPEVLQQIQQSQYLLWSLRVRFCGTLLSLAGLTAIAWHVGQRFHEKACIGDEGLGLAWRRGECMIASFISEALFALRLLLSGLSPMADDLFLTRCVLGVDIAMVAWNRRARAVSEDVCRDVYGDIYDLPCTVETGSFFVRAAVFVTIATTGMCASSASKAQQRMWLSFRTIVSLNLVDKSVRTCYSAVVGHDLFGGVTEVPVDCMALVLLCTPKFLAKMQTKLRFFLLAHGAQASGAVGLACLIDGTPPSEVVARSQERFRCVDLSDVTFNDFEKNKPDPELHRFAFSTDLGKCDGFISHSWTDDPQAKWNVLQSWRADFAEGYDREPRVWFDKYCIDQTNIEDDLRCLPVFLSGCQRLVVLCGSTYLTRLWCVLELFTYIHVGQGLDDIILLPVPPEAANAVRVAFSLFDARACKCSNPADRAKILLVIRTAFGSIDEFNEAVRDITPRVARDSSIQKSLSIQGGGRFRSMKSLREIRDLMSYSGSDGSSSDASTD